MYKFYLVFCYIDLYFVIEYVQIIYFCSDKSDKR